VRGHCLHLIPPALQGLVALAALNISSVQARLPSRAPSRLAPLPGTRACVAAVCPRLLGRASGARPPSHARLVGVSVVVRRPFKARPARGLSLEACESALQPFTGFPCLLPAPLFAAGPLVCYPGEELSNANKSFENRLVTGDPPCLGPGRRAAWLQYSSPPAITSYVLILS
jgi:hypothetical protein